jgi:uncharacterized damage-inducible protein DinB
MSTERDRFLKLFDSLVLSTNSWMDKTPDDKMDWTPVENPNMKFGDRISTITIKSVYIHTIVGETGWAKMLGECENDAVLKAKPNPELTARLSESKDLIGDTMALHTANMSAYASYDAKRLEQDLTWSGREWTVMGFLWGIYCHRAYHLGNIDIYLREADQPAPDFFSNFPQVLA